MVDAGPPIVLTAVGLILWLAVSATIGGISIQTIGLILFLVGLVWLIIEIVSNRRHATVAGPAYRERVVQEPVVREREVR
jgi:tetrahydromethanopterin S-methyltransferase subunit E